MFYFSATVALAENHYDSNFFERPKFVSDKME